MIANDQFRGRTAAGRQPRHRLVKVEPGNPSTGALRVSNAYPVIPPAGRETGLRDYPPSSAWGGLRRTGMGRGVLKVLEEYGGGSWSTNSVTKFVYDQWSLALELDGLDDDSPIARYTWGLDLSQTIQGLSAVPTAQAGAGGIGGLMMVDDTADGGFCGFYPVIPPQRRETGLRAYDGNPASGGGMCQVIDAEYPVIPDEVRHTGLREYPVIPPSGRETGLRPVTPRRPGRTRLRDPYGREIVATGDYADDNPWRFSTKYLDPLDPGDPTATLLYYGFRYLSPSLGRWMSRDPIGPVVDANISGFCHGNPTGCVDPWGLQEHRFPQEEFTEADHSYWACMRWGYSVIGDEGFISSNRPVCEDDCINEALDYVDHEIDVRTSPGALPKSSCYSIMYPDGCIPDPSSGAPLYLHKVNVEKRYTGEVSYTCIFRYHWGCVRPYPAPIEWLPTEELTKTVSVRETGKPVRDEFWGWWALDFDPCSWY